MISVLVLFLLRNTVLRICFIEDDVISDDQGQSRKTFFISHYLRRLKASTE
jgi:hypothetical protein